MSDNTLYQEVLEGYKGNVMPTHRPELLLVRGKGARVWDDQGRRYLDFTCGIGVCNLGHCPDLVTEAIQRQCARLVHVSNLFMHEAQARLAAKIVAHSFPGKVFFANSGAEANEGMIKAARKWGNPKGKSEVVAMEDSFHGRTLATLAATGRKKYRVGFEPETPGFKHVPFNDLKALEAAIDAKTAAVLLEPIQGEGGIIPAAPGYLAAVRELCDRKDVLLMYDEVQCGFGRSGKFFGYQHYGVAPDVMSMAKGLGNGFPIGAFVACDKVAGQLGAGTHASTFGGSPLACAAALAVIEMFETQDILGQCVRAAAKAAELFKGLAAKHPMVKELRGQGLMIGVALDRDTKAALAAAKAKGLLILSAGETVLRFYPPLNVTDAELEEGVGILDEVMTDMEKGT